MLLDVDSIRQPLRRIERVDPPSAFEADDLFRIVEPVVLRFEVRKSRATLRLAGTLKTAVALECSRCLETSTVPAEATFDVQYVPAVAAPGVADREVAEDDLDTAFYREGVIDLRELVREQIHLLLPMKPLCKETCAGLCPVCGTNLNTGSCACSREWDDPRLAPLKALGRKSETDA